MQHGDARLAQHRGQQVRRAHELGRRDDDGRARMVGDEHLRARHVEGRRESLVDDMRLGDASTAFSDFIRRQMSCWLTAMPFGLPVEPEV
jgi:hypothetical protein